jgi:hypothetical protein
MKLTHALMMKVPGRVNADIIVRNILLAKNPKMYPVPPDSPDAIPLTFVGYTADQSKIQLFFTIKIK